MARLRMMTTTVSSLMIMTVLLRAEAFSPMLGRCHPENPVFRPLSVRSRYSSSISSTTLLFQSFSSPDRNSPYSNHTFVDENNMNDFHPNYHNNFHGHFDQNNEHPFAQQPFQQEEEPTHWQPEERQHQRHQQRHSPFEQEEEDEPFIMAQQQNDAPERQDPFSVQQPQQPEQFGQQRQDEYYDPFAEATRRRMEQHMQQKRDQTSSQTTVGPREQQQQQQQQQQTAKDTVGSREQQQQPTQQQNPTPTSNEQTPLPPPQVINLYQVLRLPKTQQQMLEQQLEATVSSSRSDDAGSINARISNTAGTTTNIQPIKTAFRRLAKRYHPDLNQRNDNPNKPVFDTTAEFQQVNRAYEILKRQFNQDLKGDDVAFDLWLDAATAATATVHALRVPRLDVCPTCEGNGVVWNTAHGGATVTSPTTTNSRRRHGMIRHTVLDCPCCNNGCGEGGIDTDCSVCDGTGYVLSAIKAGQPPDANLEQPHHHSPREQVTCRHCAGQGVVETEARIHVTLPAFDGQPPRHHRDPKVQFQHVVPHEGNAGIRRGPRGDLVVTVHIKPLRRGRGSAFDPPAVVRPPPSSSSSFLWDQHDGGGGGYGGSSLSP